MGNKQIILVTLFILSIILSILLVIRFYPTLELRFYEISFQWNTYKKDNVSFHYIIPSQTRGIVLMIPDQRMNKYWNTYNIETNMGLKVSQFLYEHGYIPLIFDRSDAFKEPSYYLPRTELKNQILEIIKKALEWKKETFPNLKFHILAHGDGCNGLLLAIKEWNDFNQIDTIILVQCGYKNSLLDYYISLILHTMKLNKVEEKILGIATKEALDWRNQPEYQILTEDEWNKIQKELIETNVHPDLIAFRKTISTFHRHHNIIFLLESKHIYFFELLKNALKNKIKIYHIISEVDEEMPEEQIKEIQEFYKKNTFSHYHLYVLKNTDHFLFYIEKRPKAPMEYLIHRQNPFNKISEEFIKKIQEILY